MIRFLIPEQQTSLLMLADVSVNVGRYFGLDINLSLNITNESKTYAEKVHS